MAAYRYSNDRPSKIDASHYSSREQHTIEALNTGRNQVGQCNHKPTDKSWNPTQHKRCFATEEIRYRPTYQATKHCSYVAQSLWERYSDIIMLLTRAGALTAFGR